MSGKRSAPRGLSIALTALAAVYGALVRHRARRYRRGGLSSHRLPCKVVSLGNLCLGGTGKTPLAIYMARLIQAAGCRTAVLSRGYKGSAEKRGGVVSDGQRILMGAAEAGDEPYLMARHLLPAGIPVIVGRNRLQTGGLAVTRFESKVVVLDDGFQHLQLERDLDLVLLDVAQPFGNGHLLPRGTLREPIEALARADACLLTRCPLPVFDGPVTLLPDSIARMNRRRVRPVFLAAHRPSVVEYLAADRAEGKTLEAQGLVDDGAVVFAFSGLARNLEFRNSLQDMGFTLGGWMDFGDHHRYRAVDLETVVARARRIGARFLATTEKDRVKIDPAWIEDLDLIVVGVSMELGGGAGAFERFVHRHLGLG